jgi:uncharacterized Zn finger protein (UPF0148 family)
MSDFDKEAEREKLREKYEQEQERREVAEKMSELLLQGATMTNAHCSDCGDPIFRYEDQEFCATCEKPIERDTDDEPEETDGEDADPDGRNIEVTSPSDDARVQFGGDGEDRDADGTADRTAGGADDAAPADAGPTVSSSSPDRESEPSLRPSDRQRPAEASADVSAARRSLVRTLTRFSERAEGCENPGRAREHLTAAREAAETLAALR